jgi:hypothetical protein
VRGLRIVILGKAVNLRDSFLWKPVCSFDSMRSLGILIPMKTINLSCDFQRKAVWSAGF